MIKHIIYITQFDTNWLKGLEYFVDEGQLDCHILQYKTVEEVIGLDQIEKQKIYAIILDWELSSEGLNKQEAIVKLELTYPFIPVLGLYSKEHQENKHFSKFTNRFTTDPGKLLKDIQTSLYYFKHDWLSRPVNYMIYSVQVLTNNIDIVNNHKDVFFNYKHPLIGRKKAIEYFKENLQSFQIMLQAYNTKDVDKIIAPNDFIGGLVIYSGAQFDREILAGLNAEYRLYKLNKFDMENTEQAIQVNGSSSSFNVLSGIVDAEGKILLK